MTFRKASFHQVSALTLALLVAASGYATAEEAKATPKGGASNGLAATTQKPLTLSTAKTLRELIEMDDQIAIKKERKALKDEQAKERENDPLTSKDDPNLALKRSEEQLSKKRETALLASTIKINAIMGIEGQRIVQANVGGKVVTMFEGSPAIENGWKLASVQGRCASFTRAVATTVHGASAKKANAKLTSTKPASERTSDQTACFVAPPAPVIGLPSFGNGFPSNGNMPGGMPPRPVPVPVPLPLALK